MLKKFILGIAALGATGAALPAAAEAHGYRNYGYHRGYNYAPVYYDRGYYGRSYDYAPVYYDRGYYGRGYDRGYYGRGYDRGYYGRGSYDRGYYGRSRYGYRRCGNGTTGAIVGGAAGALLGREIGRGGRGFYSYRRGSGTTGAIIGGAAGALVGRSIARGC